MRRALTIFAALTLLLVAAAAAFIVFLPTERIARIAANQVKAATGRSLTLSGGLSPSIFPTLGVETGAIALANAEWGASPALISASRARIGIALAPLILGEIHIREIHLDAPVLSLEINEEGRANWEFGGADGRGDGGDGGAGGLIIDGLTIENGALTFTDRRGGAAFTLDRLNAKAALPGLDEPARMAGSAIWREEKITLDLTLATPGALLRGEEVALQAALTGDAGSVSYDGRVTPPGMERRARAAGVFHLALKDPGAAFSWAAGAPAPGVLDGLTDLRLDGDVVLAETAKAALTGAAARGDGAATLSLVATGDAGWAEGLDFAINLDIAANDAFRFVYKGGVARDEGPFPIALNGAYDLTAPAPEIAAEWAAGAAPAALADFDALALKGRVSLSRGGLSFSAKGGGMRGDRHASVDLALTGAPDWPTSRVFALKAKAGLDGVAALDFSGDVAVPEDAPPEADGALDLAASDLRALARLAGLPLPEDTPPDAFRTLAFKGGIKAHPAGGVRLKAEALSVDAASFSGALRLTPGARPALSADLRAGDLDLTPYLGASGAPPPPAGGAAWSRKRIDLAALSDFDAAIGVEVKSATLPQIRLGPSRIEAKVAEGALDLRIEGLSLHGGVVSGSVTLDGARGNAFNAALSATGVRLRPTLRDLAGVTSLEGLGAGELNISGAGGTLDEIMRSLDGFGDVKLTDGALAGYNLAAMARNLGAGFTGPGETRKTDFSEISSVFSISKGVLKTTDFTLLGPLIRVTGEGGADLGARTVKARLIPKAVATLKGQGGEREKSGVAFPLIVSGPWGDLSIRPDLKAGLNLLLSDPAGAADAARGLLREGADLGPAAADALDALIAPDRRPRPSGKKQSGKAGEKPARAVNPEDALRRLFGGGRGN